MTDKSIQQWEEVMLLYDGLEIFASNPQEKDEIGKQKSCAIDVMLSNWYGMKLTRHDHDDARSIEYNRSTEKYLRAQSRAVVTRAKLLKFRARMQQQALCKKDEKGTLSLDSSFFFRQKWERDIAGWRTLAIESNSHDMRYWFNSFEDRASDYLVAHLRELKGGDEVQYDLSTDGTGPWEII